MTPAPGSARVRSMFAQTTQNWWWTAHPAAH
ncbi:trp operon leader peptide [Streptomyces sp. NPDC003016]